MQNFEKNFNLQVGTERSKPFIKLFCQPIKEVDQVCIWLFFEEYEQQPAKEMLEKIRAKLRHDGREYGYSQKDDGHTIKTTFPTFGRLVFYLQGKGFVCRDNYGRIMKKTYPEVEVIHG